jgi:1-acyl-sn-glycerol-3-phosphate acyltransferase
MPPAAIRRPVTITTWLLLSTAWLLLSPLLLAAAAIAAAVLRRPQPLLLVRFATAYFALELRVLARCGLLWLASGFGARIRSSRFRALHYELLRAFVHRLAHRLLTLLDIDVEPELTDDARRALESDRPLLFFSRHAGPGDTLLLVDLLLSRYQRLPSVVFKDTLAIDPCVDLIGHRLPHAILDTSDREESEERIAQVAARLDQRGILVLFPEGGNFTVERRRQALRKLWRKGRRRDAERAHHMSHVMPPQPSGALAALRGNAGADVIFSAHTGLGLAAFPQEIWRHTPIGGTLTTRMWLAAAAERPNNPDEQIEWLYRWWRRLDQWVREQGEETREPEPGRSYPVGGTSSKLADPDGPPTPPDEDSAGIT